MTEEECERIAQAIEELYTHGEECAEGCCELCDAIFAAAEIARSGGAE